MTINLTSAYKDETRRLLDIHGKVNVSIETLAVVPLPKDGNRPYLCVEMLDNYGDWAKLLDVKLTQELLEKFNLHPFNGLVRVAMYGHSTLAEESFGDENLSTNNSHDLNPEQA